MRETVRDGMIPYMGKSGSDPFSALGVAKLGMSHERQDRLAEILRGGGREAFEAEVSRITGRKRRGIKKDQFYVYRVTYEKGNRFSRRKAELLERAAKNKGMSVPEYIDSKLDVAEIEKDAEG